MRMWRLSRAALATALVASGPAAAASAPASLSSEGGEEGVREASHELDIHFRGLVAEVRSRQVLVNEGERDQLAIYTFSLPKAAAITGLEIDLPNRESAQAFAVDAEAAVRPVPRPEATEGEPDLGLLRLIHRSDTHARYELRVYPVPAGASAEVSLEWAAPLSLRKGRLSLRVPARGKDARLVRERVHWRVEPPAQARGLEGAYARGAAVEIAGRSGKARAFEIESFSAPVTGDLVIEAVARTATDAPRASHGVSDLGGDLRAVAGWAYHPRTPAREPEDPPQRILFLADISRSMGAEGVARSAEIAEAIVDTAGDTARAEAIVFDRRARRVFGELREKGAELRRDLRRALAPEERENGTDLVAALELAGEVVEDGDAPPDLIVALSDGVWPSGQSADRAKAALGREALGASSVLAVTLVPDGAATPDVDAGPLAGIAHASGGLTAALRHAEVSDRAPRLVAELARPAALVSAEFASRGRRFEPLTIAETLPAGEGEVAAGFHRASEAPELSLSASRRGESLEFSSKRREVLDRLAFPLAAVSQTPSELLPLAPADPDDPSAQARALRALHEAALSSPVVTPHTSLVIPAGDAPAEARSRAAKKWGSALYRRMPPPPERAAEEELRAFVPRPAGRERSEHRPTGVLGRSAVKRALGSAMPRIRHCYRRFHRQDADLKGSLTLVVELARGEVLASRVEDAEDLPEELGQCVAEAAYAVRIPRVALGDQPESLVRARYPLSFRPGRVRPMQVELPDPDAPDLDPEDPLGGMPEKR